MARSNIVPKSFLPGKKEFFNQPSTASSPPIANAYGVRPWQLSGVFTATVPFTFPAGGVGLTSTQFLRVPISSGWPSPVVLKSTDIGSVSVFINQAAVADKWLVGMPQVQMAWAAGTAITPSSSSTAASQYTLIPGNKYSGPVLNIVLTGYLIGVNGSPQTGLLTVQAHLYGNSTA
jgi:hypothetical protein